MSWFERLTGLREDDPAAVRRQLRVAGPKLTSLGNGRTFHYGSLELATLSELRSRAERLSGSSGPLRVTEVVADVADLHADPANAGALFQAASQFNLLEMVHPSVPPEAGIGGYEDDRTQGPACAIACGAGTIYRHYLVPLPGGPGQTSKRQIDCLTGIGDYFDNPTLRHWTMSNGYALATEAGLKYLNTTLAGLAPKDYREVKDLLSVGIQWDTEVTAAPTRHRVTQVYAAALPVGYSSLAAAAWEPFARLVLAATYEATLAAAVLNRARTGNPHCYLTLVGGGVFRNEPAWLVDCVTDALLAYRRSGLTVRLVSYGRSAPEVVEIIRRLGG